MGGEDDLNASIAHFVLCCVAGNGIGHLSSGHGFTHPGMHANYFLHGILGFFHYQSGIVSNDLKPAYIVSYKATRYLALPCLMADLYRGNHALSTLHLLSGVIPFAMSLAGEEDLKLGNLVVVCNIISLCYYSATNNREWGWFTAGAAMFAYVLAPQMGPKVLYPLGLALTDYCAYRVFRVHYASP